MDQTGTDTGVAPALSAHDAINLAVSIVTGFVSNNSITTENVQTLLTQTFATINNLSAPVQNVTDAAEKPIPAVSIKKSLTPDYLISLEDGRSYKSLKRHLSGKGLTPAQYRTKWGLPSDYPMVAPNYAKQRSELARSMGLGQNRGTANPAPIAAPVTAAAATPAKAPRARKRA